MSELDECVEMASEERFVKQGWHVNRSGVSVSVVRDGFARVLVNWIGGDWYVLTYEYGSGTGRPAGEWRAEKYPADEIVMELDMTLNAMWL